ncbi:c-type cytochrome [Emcibacter sp.]|uniref:c-type cytochrome n=1 Tax=Emcibacter sp. TaxID=1979954 RepID=UPI003A90D0BA
MTGMMVVNVHASDLKTGAVLYKAYCTQCHGLEGDGYGVNAGYMDVQPRDHTEAKEMNARSDEDLFKAVKFGGSAVNKSVLMPSWGNNLSDDEIRSLVSYLRVLSNPEK